jgi:hypothetical protein
MSQADMWVSAEFERLAEIINDYDQHLFLEYIPPDRRADLTDQSQVFRIVDDRNNKIVLYASSVTNPTEILTRLWSMDNGKESVVRRLDAHNAALEALNLKRQIDEREEKKEFAAFVFKNTKSRWEHEGRIFDDQFRELGPKTVVID